MLGDLVSLQRPKVWARQGQSLSPWEPSCTCPMAHPLGVVGQAFLPPVRSLAHVRHAVGTAEGQGQSGMVCTLLSGRLAVGPKGGEVQLRSS